MTGRLCQMGVCLEPRGPHHRWRLQRGRRRGSPVAPWTRRRSHRRRPPSCTGQGQDFVDRGTLQGRHQRGVRVPLTEGLSKRNVGTLEYVTSLVKQLRYHWIIGCDANVSPDILRSSRRLDTIQGAICATNGPTCGSAELDFFVIDERFEPAVLAVAIVKDTGAKPHSAVRLYLRADLDAMWLGSRAPR